MTLSLPGLRIALVTAFPPGRQSLNEYGYHLAKGLAERDNVAEVIVLADELDDAAPELELGSKISVRRIWRFNSKASPMRIVRALRASKVDGALFNLQMATFGDREVPAALGLMTPMIARLSGTPSGVIAHNLIGGIDLDATQLKGQRVRQAIVRLGGATITKALVSGDYLTVTLDSYRKALSKSHPNADVALVPHGIFDTDERRFVPSIERPMRIVTMGKFGTYKRLETLIEAVAILRQRPGFEALELVIGGSDHPSAAGYIESLAEQCSGDANTRFHGYVAECDIPAFFEQARVSVFDYSATTGSSGVLHQTASYGAVPVFPHIGDFVDVARDEGLTGANYEPGNAKDMAEAIHSLLADPAGADRIGKSNMAAAHGMPFSDVVAFHITRIADLAGARQEPRTSSAIPSSV